MRVMRIKGVCIVALVSKILKRVFMTLTDVYVTYLECETSRL